MDPTYQKYDRMTRYSFVALFGGIIAVICLGVLHLSNIREPEIPALRSVLQADPVASPAAPSVENKTEETIETNPMSEPNADKNKLHFVLSWDKNANPAELVDPAEILKNFDIDMFVAPEGDTPKSLKERAMPIAKEKAKELVENEKFQNMFHKAIAKMNASKKQIN